MQRTAWLARGTPLVGMNELLGFLQDFTRIQFCFVIGFYLDFNMNLLGFLRIFNRILFIKRFTREVIMN